MDKEVYVVEEDLISEINILGVFSTEKKAEKALERYKKDKECSDLISYKIRVLELNVIEYFQFDETDLKIHCIRITDTERIDSVAKKVRNE